MNRSDTCVTGELYIAIWKLESDSVHLENFPTLNPTPYFGSYSGANGWLSVSGAWVWGELSPGYRSNSMMWTGSGC